jgi:RHS repeat-associated protein
VGGVYKRIEYDITGKPASVVDSAGTQVSLVPAEGSNNTLTGMILPNGNENLGAQIQYTAGKPTSVTLPNGNQTTHSYDAIGRLTATTLPSGATVSTAYGTEPSTVTAVVENRWRKTTLNGFAQIVKEEHGNESGTQSTVRYEYGPAANAPVGKLKRQSLPYGAGNKPQWVNSAYDDMGRTISQDLPNTGVPKKISYSGNAVQVTDPAGRWKKIIHNASGKIAKVIMPDANGSSHLETMYSYNALGDLTSVTMPRSNGTQIRRFAYDAGGRVVVRQHAESGKQTRTYNSDGTLASQTDAKGQKHVYTRDTYKRIVSVNRYDAAGALQPNDSYAYYYDTNPFDSSFSQNVQGRLAAVQWGSANTLSGLFTEMYSYTASGQLAAKRLRLNRGTNDADLDIQLSYDTEGRLASIIYPGGSPTLTYTYDSMGRLNGALTSTDSVVKDVAYNSLGQLTDIKLLANNEDQYLSQGYIYNSRNRLTRVLALPENSSDESATLPTVDLEYAYRKDDGKLLAETDHVANKSVSYDYDNHGRILSAQSSDAAWGLGFAYDGFGNRVSQSVTQGQAYAFQVRHDPATNWMLSDDMVYDANGNIVRLPQMDLGYDVQNRMVHMRNSATGEEWYGYDHKNLRIWKKAANGREILSLYEGTKRLATYIVLTDATGNISLKLRESNIFFGRRMVQSGGEVVVLDRLGATRAWSGKRGAGSTKYLPFGEELQRTSDKLNKFGGYERDSASGLDYAEQRYYSSSLGRFITPDPYEKSAHIGSPDTWNRYAFVGNDPVNRVDPHGLNATGADITVPTSELGDDHSFVMQYSDGTSALFLANNTTGDIDVEFEFNTQGVLTDIVGYSAEAGSVNGVPMLYTPDALADILLDDATSYFRDAANNTLLGTIASSIGGPILGGVSEGTQMNAATDTEMAINDEKWAVWILSQSTKQ